jgi:aspartate racemase
VLSHDLLRRRARSRFARAPGSVDAFAFVRGVEVVAEEAVQRGFERLGITGTRWLVESEVYPGKLDAKQIDYVRPTAAECAEMHRILMEELVHGVFKPEGIAYFQQVFSRMRRGGCDAVILGCTEIPLILNDANSPLPTLDSTRLFARAALRRSTDGTTRQDGRSGRT